MLASLLVAAATAAAPLAQHWIAVSNTALAITGDVTFTPARVVFQNGKRITIQRESGGTYETYRITSRTNPMLLNGNTLCGEFTPSYFTVRYGRGTSSTETLVSAAMYSGSKPPRRWNDPENLCATFTYSMKPAQTAVAELSAKSNGFVMSVQGTVHGTPVRFDVDSGATHTILDTQTASALDLPLGPTQNIRGAGTGTVPAADIDGFTVSLGGASFAPADPLAVDLSGIGSQLPEEGILGFDFFQRYVVDFDYDAMVVRLYDPASFVYRGSGARIPLVVQAPRIFVNVRVSARGVAPEEHTLRLDFGSDDSVDDDIALLSSGPKQTITAGMGIGQPFTTLLGTVNAQLGPYDFENVPSATGGVQLIGAGVLHRFNIVIDVSRAVMYMTPRSSH